MLFSLGFGRHARLPPNRVSTRRELPYCALDAICSRIFAAVFFPRVFFSSCGLFSFPLFNFQARLHRSSPVLLLPLPFFYSPPYCRLLWSSTFLTSLSYCAYQFDSWNSATVRRGAPALVALVLPANTRCTYPCFKHIHSTFHLTP